MLGGYPVGTAAGFLQYSSLVEDPGDILSATEMVTRLVNDHEEIIRGLRGAINTCTDEFHDAGNADFLTGQMEQHESPEKLSKGSTASDSIEPGTTAAVGVDVFPSESLAAFSALLWITNQTPPSVSRIARAAIPINCTRLEGQTMQ